MKREEIKADVLKRLEARAEGMRSAEISDLYGMGCERRAGHLMESLKPAVMAMRVPSSTHWVSHWVATSRAPEIRARLQTERKARALKNAEQSAARKRAQRAGREWTPGSAWEPPPPRVASVWDLAKAVA